jgi:hypothetical protein
MDKKKKRTDPTATEPAYKGLALADVKSRKKNTNISLPSEQAVEQAKEWVDDGSRL